MTSKRNATASAGQKSNKNDGGFAKADPNSEADCSVLDQIAASYEDGRLDRMIAGVAESQRIILAAETAMYNGVVDVIRETLSRTFESATHATFHRDFETDTAELDVVYGATGEVLYSRETEPRFSSTWNLMNSGTNSVNNLLISIDIKADEYLGTATQVADDEDADYGRVDYNLSLAADHPHHTISPADIIDVKNMSRSDRSAVIRDVGFEHGLLDSGADKDEIEYRIFEQPQNFGFDPAVAAALEERLGGREAMLDALADTDAWVEIGEDISEQTSRILSDKLQNAIDELSA
jgi:hypothetical protein